MEPSNSENNCSECGESPGKFKRLRKIFCPKCWIYHCDFKFRKRLYELGKVTKGTRHSSRDSTTGGLGSPEVVLIYYDCSPSAKALLSMIRGTILAKKVDPAESERNKHPPPFPFVFQILFIHDSVDPKKGQPESGTTQNELEGLRSWIRESKDGFGVEIPLLVSSLEKSLSSSDSDDTEWKEMVATDVSVDFPFDPDLHFRVVELVDNLKSVSSRLDFLQCLRNNLIVSIAEHRKVSKILLPDQQTSMSVKMFSMMSLGRGAQLAEQMRLVSKVGNVELARPLMDLSSDDLLDYLNSLEAGKPTTLGNKENKIDNIRSQCEDFIVRLQKDFPGTVPTLTKIGAKLDTNSRCSTTTTTTFPQVSNCRLCRLCKQRVEENIETSEFCYGCSNILKEMKDASLLLGLLKP